jgi:hypothetical protein
MALSPIAEPMIGKHILCVGIMVLSLQARSQLVIARQGRVAFFSHTPVEHIKAENDRAMAIIDLANGKIAVSMLMRAFVFEKALMREHFNESYVESDLYPKATFEGKILGFEPYGVEEQTRMVLGQFSMHGISREVEIKTRIESGLGHYVLSGSFEVRVRDYEIRIPALLAGNIAETVAVDFIFEFMPYEN